MHERLSFYTDAVNTAQKNLDIINRKSLQVSYLRITLALLAIGAIYLGFTLNYNFLWVSAVLMIFFLMLVQKSAALTRETLILREILKINEREVSFINGDKSVFETGHESDIHGHLYGADLDIVGTGSLFQSVSRTCTMEGRRKLMHTLLEPPSQVPVILKRQEAITELGPMNAWRQRFHAMGMHTGETAADVAELSSWARQEAFFDGRQHWLWIAGIMTALSGSLIAWMIATVTFYAVPFFILLFLNYFLLAFLAKPTKVYFNQFGRRTTLLARFADLYSHIARQQFTSTLTLHIHATSASAFAAFLRLSRLSNLADARLNGMVGPVMNGLFFFDIWCILRIEQWRKTHRHGIDAWISSLAEMDTLNSLGNFSFNHPSFTLPTIVTDKMEISARQMGHPLMPFHQSVKNDYQIGGESKANIITGSNMAGKSTFIRGVGLNVVLALNGLPVCASSFTCPVLHIVTCIRITDSLEEDVSYFKAELVRLEKIIHILKGGAPCLVLLDEILRGTNSDDKRSGTMAFYRKLQQYNCLSLLATHDLSIGQLQDEQPHVFTNLCFESSVEGGELIFDYRLRKGVSGSANATFLMKRMGII